jgi:hypothetical protein
MIAAIFAAVVAPFQELVQSLGELIQRDVGIPIFRRRDQVGAAQLHLGGGGKVVVLSKALVTVQTDIDPNDPGVVLQEGAEFFPDGGLKPRRQLHVDALHENFIGLVALHEPMLMQHGGDGHRVKNVIPHGE